MKGHKTFLDQTLNNFTFIFVRNFISHYGEIYKNN